MIHLTKIFKFHLQEHYPSSLKMRKLSHSQVPVKKPQSVLHSRKLWPNRSSSLFQGLPSSCKLTHFLIGVYCSVKRVFTDHFV